MECARIREWVEDALKLPVEVRRVADASYEVRLDDTEAARRFIMRHVYPHAKIVIAIPPSRERLTLTFVLCD